jgi:hypothetical protein
MKKIEDNNTLVFIVDARYATTQPREHMTRTAAAARVCRSRSGVSEGGLGGLGCSLGASVVIGIASHVGRCHNDASLFSLSPCPLDTRDEDVLRGIPALSPGVVVEMVWL